MSLCVASTPAKLLLVYGIGSRKIEDYGEAILRCIAEHCAEHGMPMDAEAAPVVVAPRPAKMSAMTASKAQAYDLFREGSAIEDVVHQTGRARTTVTEYLCDFIVQEKPASVETWVAAELYDRVAAMVRQHGCGKLKPLFIALEEKVTYDEIRIVVAHLSRDQ